MVLNYLVHPEELIHQYYIYFASLQLKKVAKCYLQEVEWYAIDFVPTFEEHLKVSLVTTSYRMLACASFVGMGDVATKEAFEWVATFPDIVKASTMISRCLDDVVSAEVFTLLHFELALKFSILIRVTSDNILKRNVNKAYNHYTLI